jgi:3-oxoisoapionate decarboxylase
MSMKIGIDSYCYHRYFGEVYPVQSAPDTTMTIENFLSRTVQLGAEGVSLESCFLPRRDTAYLSELCARLDELELERVYAWGHPNGLLGGKSPEAYDDMILSIAQAGAVKADVMRVVGNNGRFRFDEHEKQIDRLSALFADAVKEAEAQGVRLAIENHQDFTLEELAALLDNVNSPYFGLTFDSGNCLRILDDPVKGLERVAPRVLATHIKDIRLQRGMPADRWQFFACVPAGEGVVDLSRIIEILKAAGYGGMVTVELDYLHSDYENQEDRVLALSLENLRRLI